MMTPSATTGLWLAAAALIPAASLPGCSQALGIEPLPAAEPFAYAEPNCLACIEQSCQPQEDACRVDTNCAAHYACLASCPPDDWSCRGSCESPREHLLQEPTIAALDGCRRTHCLDQCLGIGSPATAHGQACNSCTATACVETTRACLQDADCERKVRCALSCTDPDCSIACVNRQDSTDGSIINEYLSCLVSCPEVCPFGEAWQCVGDYDWRPPKSPGQPITVRFHVDALVGDRPAGVTVRACQDVPPPCLELASAKTDDTGAAELQLDAPIHGFTGYLEVSGQAHGDDLITQMVDYDRPLVSDELNLGNIGFTESIFAQYSESLGVELMAERGHLQLTIWDCASLWARGVRFEIEGGALPADPPHFEYYFGGEVTDEQGTAAFINVPPGEVTISAYSGTKQVATFVTHVVKGQLTAACLWPDPR